MKNIISLLGMVLVLSSCATIPVDNTLPDAFVKKANEIYKIYVPNELRTDISYDMYQQRNLLISYDSTARYQLRFYKENYSKIPKKYGRVLTHSLLNLSIHNFIQQN